jgi:hypothetical protein
MNKTIRSGLLLFCVMIMTAFFADNIHAQGVTTSTLNGVVTDDSGEPLTGANILAIHEPTGTTYGAASDLNGNYRISNMRVGGPYTVRVSFTGFTSSEIRELFLRLGETERRNFELSEMALELEAITVSALAGSAGQSSGTSTQISSESITTLPSISRNINDFLRLTPQSSGYGGDGITFAGMNNRFNAIYIDGAVNNDVFGLASSGTNGGQTGISPFSLDIIDQLQVVISPYDVTLGGFAGGGVNAVTKSGTNNFSASVYRYIQNESLVGKTNKTQADRFNTEREKVDEFTQSKYGLSISGPIVQDKLFFFLNAEIQDDETPRPFNPVEYTSVAGRSQTADLERLRNHVINTYGYDPGAYGNTQGALGGTKLFAKIDYNINRDHRLTLRHQYTDAEQSNRFQSNSRTINFSNNGIFFPSTTNSTALELNSVFGNNYTNNLILSYVSVRDNRRWLGDPFPYVLIRDASGGLIRMGTEPFSTANELTQDIFAITNNFQIFRGNHIITIGTHNEFYDIYNLFIPQNFGQYTYANIDAFINNDLPAAYARGYSLVDNITGPGSQAAAAFNAMQLGFYAQDEWTVNSNLTLTYGLRIDIPIITSDPKDDGYINSTALPAISQYYSVANNVRGGQAPDGQIMFSPRAGFSYDTFNDMGLKVRGGLGIFTSRIPFVWPGAMFNENGVTRGYVTLGNLGDGYNGFRSDINNQYVHPNIALPQGNISVFSKDFKYPQVFRTNLATDFELPYGVRTTLEAIYTKTLNALYYQNINSNPTVKFKWTGSSDNRPVYVNQDIVSQYSSVYLGQNTSEGYGYNVSATFAKDFDFGLDATVAYSYGDSKSLADNTSSQNSSQWRGQVNIDGRNNPAYGRSDFAAGHRVITALNYRFNWTGDTNNSTTVSLFMNAQSGTPYSYVLGGGIRNIAAERGSTSNNRSLVFVPASQNQINLIPVGNLSPDEQWTNLNNYIENSKYLSSRRGEYAEKNGAFGPFTSIFDIGIRQDVGMNIGGQRHRFQISADIMNVANLINPEWGVQYAIPGDFNSYELYNFAGYAADGTTPQFTYTGVEIQEDSFNFNGNASRWRMQFGVKYMLN